jgi:hypothetical protein
MKYPINPIATAATTLPAELNVWFRPWRRLKSLCPTIPSEIAAMAGIKKLEIAPISTWAVTTGQNDGSNAINSAPIANANTGAAISVRLDLSRSTKAPAGVCDAMPAMPPIVRIRPTRCSLQPYAAR